MNKRRAHTKTKPDKMIDMVPHRECAICYTYKPMTEFYVNRNCLHVGGTISNPQRANHQQLKPYCKACENRR